MYSKVNVVGAAPQGVLWGIKDGLFGGSLTKNYPSLQAEFDKELLINVTCCFLLVKSEFVDFS